jgi:hypothetical protein
MGAKVYESIANVMADLSGAGIGKDRKNQQQGYNFRGIDDVYNSLAPVLARNKLCILPRVVDHHVIERESRNGGALFTTTVKMEFDLVCSEDGSKHTVTTIGEAMDSADKSSNKAQSAAYKYMAFQTFCIPTEGDNDADSHTPEVKGKARNQPVDKADKKLLEAAVQAAGNGTAAYTEFWNGITAEQKSAIGKNRHEDFWIKATDVDERLATEGQE